MKSPVAKRSILVGGHKTSVSLEEAFWTAVKEISRQGDMSLSDLASEIERNLQHGNLSSAIRVYVLGYFKNRAADAITQKDHGILRYDKGRETVPAGGGKIGRSRSVPLIPCRARKGASSKGDEPGPRGYEATVGIEIDRIAIRRSVGGASEYADAAIVVFADAIELLLEDGVEAVVARVTHSRTRTGLLADGHCFPARGKYFTASERRRICRPFERLRQRYGTQQRIRRRVGEALASALGCVFSFAPEYEYRGHRGSFRRSGARHIGPAYS